ncbi:MAG: hypothetical protein QM500_14535 [Methylococcales bacterium]
MDFKKIKYIFEMMGNGLMMQNLGEMRPDEMKIIEMDMVSSNVDESKHIICVINENIKQNVLDYSINSAMCEGGVLEVLYYSKFKHRKNIIRKVIKSINNKNISFQITLLSGVLIDEISSYLRSQMGSLSIVFADSNDLIEYLKNHKLINLNTEEALSQMSEVNGTV